MKTVFLVLFLISFSLPATGLGSDISGKVGENIYAEIASSKDALATHGEMINYLDGLKAAGNIVFIPNHDKNEGKIVQPQTFGQKVMDFLVDKVPLSKFVGSITEVALKDMIESFELFRSSQTVKPLDLARKQYNLILDRVKKSITYFEIEKVEHFSTVVQPAFRGLQSACLQASEDKAKSNEQEAQFFALRNQCNQVFRLYLTWYPNLR